ncbi:CaiB/BaiF CoA-transferase family protein [Sphingomonas sp. LY160]|uniref:CaiB/BaiF CoA transferase family protein n=1 Tax=Sphingomonas sp. LY160 TaxID=3095342 RepID=UPI002ADEEE37|nr:CaiB/BaiF CoA-transferase family protein [Sphingomonas sp. LY160]MEA1071559.1 CaiB/BaiF CoA-transferase family protein [Sphingomonas sp. LY160]
MKPLDGIRVLDLSRVLAGPWATQTLADLGAEVIKVEQPGAGDDTRHWGPPWHEHDGEKVAAYFLAANRGKRSVAIDFSSPDGAALVRRMAESCDVLVENFKVGGLAKFGLDAASLRAANPRLIYASITGFGQDGPYAQRAGYDYIIQAMGGLMSLTGQPDGVPGGGPMRTGVAVADLFTGMYTANAIMAALVGRARTGKGATIDMALFDTQLAMLANQASNALVSGRDPGRQGAGHPNIVPYQPFDASDQAVVVAVGNDRQFARFADILGHAEWASDAAYSTNAARVASRDRLVPMIEAIMAEHPAAHWLEKLETAGIPAGPINGVRRALSDPQARHRGVRVTAGGGALGEVPMVGSPIRIDGERQDAPLPPPALGEHGDLLREWLGNDELERLRAAGVVG